MTKYEEFKNRKILTVGELIEKLKQLPQNASLQSDGADLGGYDICSASYIDINYDKENNIVCFSHMEAEMYEAQRKGLITYEQFKELNNETNEN